MRSVVLRADGGAQVGLGHLARCLTLAEALRASGVATTFVAAAEGTFLERIAAAGHELVASAAVVGSPEDAAATAHVARTRGAELIVVDGYRFLDAYRLSLQRAGATVLLVDDPGGSTVGADVVLNGNLYATADLYPQRHPDDLLVGPAFALVRADVVRARDARRTGRDDVAARVLITMGGADPPGFSLVALRAVAARTRRTQGPPVEARVLVGAANPRLDELRRAAGEVPRVSIVHDAQDVAAHMLWCDVAIAAAGVTCSELACIGVPAIAVPLADNQRPVAAELVRRGLMRSPGWHEDVTPDTLARELAELLDDAEARRAMIDGQRACIDGGGAQRILRALSSRRGG